MLLASVFGQNESGMGYCWIVIRAYVVISVASGLKYRSLMLLCADFRGVWMLMLMLRCLRCCVEWIALYYFEVVWMMQCLLFTLTLQVVLTSHYIYTVVRGFNNGIK